MTINFQGTKNTLELAKIHNAKILFTSTSINNDDIVDESNKLAKKLIHEYKKNHNIDVKIINVDDDCSTKKLIDIMNSNNSNLCGEH